MTNKFATINLNKRINAKADELCLVGLARDVFIFIAQGCGEVGINGLRRRFDANFTDAVVVLADLMTREIVFQPHHSSYYYALAV